MSTPIFASEAAETLNRALSALGCAARIDPSPQPQHSHRLELQNEEGDFLDFIPLDASAEMIVVAYRLYGRGLNQGTRAGEEAAWAKLRTLIRAAPADSNR